MELYQFDSIPHYHVLDAPFHVILLKGIEIIIFLDNNFLNYIRTILVNRFRQQTAE
jgi:hypothetical protein